MQQARLKAGILVSQIEQAVCGGRVVFSCNHPLYCWALLRGCWIHNRYVVNGGVTAIELSSDRQYTGRLCIFGETALGYLKTSRKAAPRWMKGIWLGKTLTNVTHILACESGIFVTRSVRRLPKP